MNPWKMLPILTLLLLHTTLATAKGDNSFNGLPILENTPVDQAPRYGEYQPSQFSDNHSVVLIS